MFDSLLYGINAVFPLIAVILLGYFLKRSGFLPESFFSSSNKLVFKVAMPALIFKQLYDVDFGNVYNSEFMILGLLFLAASFAISWILSLVLVKDKSKRGAFAQGTARGNFTIISLPVSQILFGETGLGIAAMFLPLAVIINNSLSVVFLSIGKDEDGADKKKAALGIVKSIVTNPLVIAMVIALAFRGMSFITIPEFVKTGVTYVSNLTMPLALLSMGAGFSFDKLKGRLKLAIIASVFKTFVFPLIYCTVSILCGLTGEYLGVIFIMFSGPTSVSSYVMADGMNADTELAGQIVVLTSILSAFSMFLGLTILNSLKYIS